MNPVIHFEMPYEDRDRMAQFYGSAFGWQAHKLGPEMGNYVTVATGETDENRMLKKPGMINGGFFQKTTEANKGGGSVSIVIGVDDINEATNKVEAAGGKVLGGASKPGEPDDIPGVGLYSSFIDSEGNRVGMLQPKPGSNPPEAK